MIFGHIGFFPYMFIVNNYFQFKLQLCITVTRQ